MATTIAVDLGDSLVKLINDLEDPRSNILPDNLSLLINEIIYSMSYITTATCTKEHYFEEAYNSYLRESFRCVEADPDDFSKKAIGDFYTKIFYQLLNIRLIGDARLRTCEVVALSMSTLILRIP